MPSVLRTAQELPRRSVVEFEIGRYVRRFTLPEAIDHDRIEARTTDGALRLVLPKPERALPRSIIMKTG